MKFGKRFENSKIAEWADFYVSYRSLKKLLSPFKAIGKCKLNDFLKTIMSLKIICIVL